MHILSGHSRFPCMAFLPQKGNMEHREDEHNQRHGAQSQVLGLVGCKSGAQGNGCFAEHTNLSYHPLWVKKQQPFPKDQGRNKWTVEVRPYQTLLFKECFRMLLKQKSHPCANSPSVITANQCPLPSLQAIFTLHNLILPTYLKYCEN